ncbi:hypothetical protein EXN66_Car008041 [Channa argus]|uniref:Uncharacterized protein n=1 Tax=Channa argus TaxID=215402 RepID=A0A6G1PQ12_CHAAH|nr:hypothetical protein EXN66_Car008041 [Channa argus]
MMRSQIIWLNWTLQKQQSEAPPMPTYLLCLVSVEAEVQLQTISQSSPVQRLQVGSRGR